MPLAWEIPALDRIQPLGTSPSQHQPIWTKLTVYHPSLSSLSRQTGEDPVSIAIQADGQELKWKSHPNVYLLWRVAPINEVLNDRVNKTLRKTLFLTWELNCYSTFNKKLNILFHNKCFILQLHLWFINCRVRAYHCPQGTFLFLHTSRLKLIYIHQD